MSCWVAPAVAAELWGISIEDVLERVRNGQLASRTELGFVVVDVAPDSPAMPAPAPRPVPRTTFVTVVQPPAEPEAVPVQREFDDPPATWERPRRRATLRRRAPGAPAIAFDRPGRAAA